MSAPLTDEEITQIREVWAPGSEQIRRLLFSLAYYRDAAERELEVLTLERDNALLRIEELEAVLEQYRDDNKRRGLEFFGGGMHHNGPESSYRGGVHPNA